jgi:diguanylate cyclase (GGDEF)-like protein
MEEQHIDPHKRSILIVDDNPQNIQLVASHLRQEGYRISFSQSGRDVLQKIEKVSFDLILLDIMMPEMDGFEICTRVREHPEYREVPIIFLTAKIDKESIVKGFEVGAVDYIVKPFHGSELLARIRTHLDLKAYREKVEQINIQLNKEILNGIKMQEELEASKAELEKMNRKLYEKATKDALTKLFNRRKMTDLIEYEYDRALRNKLPFSIIITDIDHFKKVNDTYGHDCGDVVLEEVSETLMAMIRKQDQVGRWGGEEFLLLLPETDTEGALILAEKIRAEIEKSCYYCDQTKLKITMTFGISSFCDEKTDKTVMKEADLALYDGKNSGRNRCITYQS